jgi:ABC-type transport system involved in multi-copper enzyme maturation permease subunit
MRAQLAAEMLKLRSTRTTAGLVASMLVLVVAAVVLHGYGLPASKLETPADQLTFLVGWGEVLGAIFAGLAGAISFTGEVRHGTIRPTLLATPRRGRVVAAKCLTGSLAGLVFGLVATSVAAATGRIALAVQGIDVALDGGDYALLIAGGAAAAALWAVIGLGVGAIVRNQVPTIVGLLAWLLFVEGVLVDNAPGLGRFAPGALGQSLSGLHPDTLLAPALGALLLAVYATGALAAGTVATVRRDVE